MTPILSRRERKRLLKEWIAELGGDAVAVRRILRCTQAALDVAINGADDVNGDEAAHLDAITAIDAALRSRADQTDRSYGRVLRALRMASGQTSDAVARACVIATSRMTEYERGQVKPTLDVALRLWRHFAARYPGLRFEEVFGGDLAAGDVTRRCAELTPTTATKEA